MINSVKYILKERKMQQKELINNGVKKQYISRWINRERKFDVLQLQFWIEKLNVPEKFIVDNDGYCKLLNDNEFIELKNYLFNQKLDLMPSKIRDSTGTILLERRHDLNTKISKLQKALRKDIINTVYYLSTLDNEGELSLDASIVNAEFYENIINLHKNKALNLDEWFLLINALSNINENMTSQSHKEEVILINSIRKSIQNYRKYIETKEKERFRHNHNLALEFMEMFDYELKE